MTTLTFDIVTASARRRSPARSIRRLPATPVAMAAAASFAAPRRAPLSGALLVGAIVALHAGAVLSFGGSAPVARSAAPVPITISLAPPPKVAPPPPPPPPKPEPPPPRPKFVTPRVASAAPAAAPVVAADTALVAASADTVQLARAPVEAAPEPAPPKVDEPVTEPKGYAGYLRNPAPDYPPAAQKRGLEGKVVLKVHVLATGQPDNVTVARSSGHQILDDAALKAVTQWAFAPARRGQTPIDGWVQVPLTFKI
jgi:protein TonB